ncbi:hypothetical protein ACFLUV_04775 [Elusimicrobiota bacterium]
MIVNTIDDYGNPKPASKEEILTLGSPDSTECGFITNKGTFKKRNSIWTPSSPPVMAVATGTYETSFRYTDNKRGTPRIDIEGTGTPGNTWGPGQQVQTVNAADLHHLGFISDPYTSGNPLLAGATSWAIVVQSQDRFDNRKELTSTEEIVLFLKDKTSGISGDDADFDFSKDNGTWQEISSVYITTNSATSDFYMKVFRAKPAIGDVWELEAKLKSGGFDSATQDVVVRGGEISQIVITTPPRKIVADHLDYLTYGATNYVITIETQDKFGNISNITDVNQVRFSVWGDSIDADFASHGGILQWGANMITISSGSYTTSFYYADLLKGDHMIYVDEVEESGYPPKDWTLAAQQVEVYPSGISGFEVNHDGFALVGVDESAVIRAVDGTRHANFADGHPQLNDPYGSTDTWHYYTGIADMATDAPAHPPGKEPTLNYISWDFQDSLDSGNPGLASIMVRDGIVTDDGERPSDPPDTWDVPPIKVLVVDRSTPTINGTSLGLIVAGAIVEPYTDPESGDRVAPEFIYQDNQNVLIERLDMWTNYSTSTWNGMRAYIDGTANSAPNTVDIEAIRLWKDGDGDAVFTKPALNDLNNEMATSPDVLLSSAAIKPSPVVAQQKNIQLDTDQMIGVNQTISEARNFYFITVDCAYTAQENSYMKLYWEKQYFTGAGNWSPVGAQLSDNNFNIITPTTTVKSTPGRVIVDEYQLIESTDTVAQGQDKVGFVRLDMHTDKYTINWKEINLTLVGANAKDRDIKNIKIYKDLGDQKFEPAAEMLVSRGDDEFGTWGSHGSGVDGVANIVLWNPSPFIDEPKEQVINTSTQTYFIALTFDDSASYDPVNNIGIRIESNVDIKAEDENGFNRVLNLGQFPIESGTPQVVPTVDKLLVDWNKPPGNVPQGSDNKVFAILNLRSDAHSVWWEGVTVDKIGTLPEQYIENVKVWWYISGSTNTLGYPEINISTDIPVGNRDVLVSEGVDVFVSSQCVINFPETKYRDLRTGATTFLITMDIDPFAPKATTVGLSIPHTTYWKLAWPDSIDVSYSTTNPVLVTEKTIVEYADKVTVTPEDVFTKLVADAMLNQSDEDLPMIELELKTALSYAWWQDNTVAGQAALKIFNEGTADDWEIADIQLWYDATDDGQLQKNLDVLVSSGNVFGAKVARSCEVFIPPSRKQEILPASKAYFITININDMAIPGHTIKLAIKEAANFTVADPDFVAETNLEPDFETDEYTIYASPRILYVTGIDTAPVSATQGDEDVCMEILQMRVDGYQVEWEQLSIKRTGTKGTSDTDVKLVKLYKDVHKLGDAGYGRLNEHKDILIATGTFVSKNATLDFREHYGTQMVSTETAHWFIAYDIAADATPGATLGAQVAMNNSFFVAYPHSVSTRTYAGATAFPISSSWTGIDATVDDMITEWFDAGLGKVTQGDESVHVASLVLKANQNSVIWTGLNVHRTGNSTDDDISIATIYYDSNNDGLFEPEDDGGPDELISYGAEVFIDTVCAIRFSDPQSIFPEPNQKRYFLAYNIASLAEVGGTVGAEILGPADFIIDGLTDSVIANPGYSTLADIEEYPDRVTATPYRTGVNNDTPVNQANVVQGEKDVLMEHLKITTRTGDQGDTESEAAITGMRIKMAGDLPPSKIDAVKIYKDANNDSQFNPEEDLLISCGTDTFKVADTVNIYFNSPQIIGPVPRNYFITYDFSMDADPVSGASTNLDSVGYFFVETPNFMGTYEELNGTPGQQPGEEPNIFPIESGMSTVRTIEFNFKAQDTAPAGARQGDKGVQMARFRIRVGTNTARGAEGEPAFSQLRVTLKGDLHYSKINSVRIYKDSDGDGKLNIKKDILCSSGNDKFDAANTSLIDLTNNNIITDEYQDFFLAYNIAEDAYVGRFIGAQIDLNNNNYISIGSDQRIILEEGDTVPFFITEAVIIRHTYAPTTPVVNVQRWINSATTVKGEWKSRTDSPHGVVHNLYSAYNSPYKDAGEGQKAKATVQGLSLKHGESYKYRVKTASWDDDKNNIWSETGEATFTVDLNPPSAAGAPVPQQEQTAGVMTAYNVNWKRAKDNKTKKESGVAKYELQERKDTSPIWKSIMIISGDDNNVFIEDQEEGHFYYYRVRAQDKAGNWGIWSAESEAAVTGLPDKAIEKVSNYPNPVRFDKGDAKTKITYLLKEDSSVEVYLYDMMGYLVKKWKFNKGEEGGKRGSNFFDWFGVNEEDAKVAKGGYILRIVVKSSEGTVERTRKIGIIR